MQTLSRLGAGDLAAVMRVYRDALRDHRERINRFNVFPVPDGDTGTNMALTMESVVDDLPADPDSDLAGVAQIIGRGSLMGARGNSGLILWQSLRGLSCAIAAAGLLDARTRATGLARASEGAWKAVHQPVEGTILSVARAAADGAAAAGDDAGLAAVARSARAAATAALQSTTEQLPALRAAGVVDSGGSGLVLLLDALQYVIDGTPVPGAAELPAAAAREADAPADRRARMGCRYEVMFLLEAPEEALDGFRSVWASLGDSIV